MVRELEFLRNLAWNFGCVQICRHHSNIAGTVVNGFHDMICSLLFISALIKGDHRIISPLSIITNLYTTFSNLLIIHEA